MGNLASNYSVKPKGRTGQRLWALVFSLAIICGTERGSAAPKQNNQKLGGDIFGGINVKANDMNIKGPIIELSGEVSLIYNQQSVTCQKATIHRKTKRLVAEGEVEVNTPTLHIEAEKIEMNLKRHESTIYQGLVKSGQVEFKGDVIYRVGEDDYDVINGHYTACTTCPPGWSVSAKKIKAQFGGYATLDSTFFKLANVPILWFPKLLIPLKTTRQTGLLPPSFITSTQDGLIFSESYFWALSESQDATLTMQHYSLRGPAAHLNYRYMLSPLSYGELNIGRHFQDRIFGQDPLFNSNGYRASEDLYRPVDRWFLSYQHIYDLPNGYMQKTKIDTVGDLRYVRDFPKELAGNGDAALENRVSLTQNIDDRHASIDTAYYTNLLKSNPMDKNQDTVHRFPEIRYSLIEKKYFGSGLFKMDAQYVNFARSGLSYDNVSAPIGDPARKLESGSGPFEVGKDLIRAGQRFDARPTIAYPTKIGSYLDFLPELSFRETGYFFGIKEQPTVQRETLRSNLSLKTHLSRIYGEDAENVTRYKHEIIPEITHTSIPYLNQSDSAHTFLPASDSISRRNQPINDDDFLKTNGVHFDYTDRIYDRNFITLQLSNKLVRKEWLDGQPNYSQIALVKVSQSYDVYESYGTQGGTPRPLSELRAAIEVNVASFETNTVFLYQPYYNVTDTNSRVRFKQGSNFFETQYSFSHGLITNSNATNYAERKEQLNFTVGLERPYYTLAGTLSFQPVTEFNSTYRVSGWHYSLTIVPPGNCWSILIDHAHEIATNNTTLGFSFAFKFDGKTNVSTKPTIFKPG